MTSTSSRIREDSSEFLLSIVAFEARFRRHMTKPILLLLVLSNVCLGQGKEARLSAEDSLSQSLAHKVDAGPQVGLGIGAGSGFSFFLMAAWQINNEFAVEGRYNATSGPGSIFFFGGPVGWSLLVRRQLPDIDCYLFAGPSVENSWFNSIANPANPTSNFVTKYYSAYYLTIGAGWGLHWFSVELDAMVPVQPLMRTPQPPQLPTDNPDAGQSINPFAVYLVLKPHLDLFFFH